MVTPCCLHRVTCLVVVVACGIQKAPGQQLTVQLPTFRQFSMSTTVLVPDRGGSHLGGVGYHRGQTSSLGMPLLPVRNRQSSTRTPATGVSVHAWIHDLDAMDQAVLDQWAASPEATASKRNSRLSTLPEPPNPRPVSLAELRRRQQATEQFDRQQALADLRAGQHAEADGKPAVARIYYRMALRRATGDLHEAISARLDAFDEPRIARDARPAARVTQ